tara:strand:- start:4023 stop:4499 length:477 start_codon:yes stop_codon:yes gene_type:complete
MTIKRKKARSKGTSPRKKATKAATNEKVASSKSPGRKALPAIRKKMTKSQIVSNLAEHTGLNKKEVELVLQEIESLIERSIKKKGVGEFTLPGLMKITTVKKPARKARKGTNPFTGEEVLFRARSAEVAVKIRPLRKLRKFAELDNGTGSPGPGKPED